LAGSSPALTSFMSMTVVWRGARVTLVPRLRSNGRARLSPEPSIASSPPDAGVAAA